VDGRGRKEDVCKGFASLPLIFIFMGGGKKKERGALGYSRGSGEGKETTDRDRLPVIRVARESNPFSPSLRSGRGGEERGEDLVGLGKT